MNNTSFEVKKSKATTNKHIIEHKKTWQAKYKQTHEISHAKKSIIKQIGHLKITITTTDFEPMWYILL